MRWLVVLLLVACGGPVEGPQSPREELNGPREESPREAPTVEKTRIVEGSDGTVDGVVASEATGSGLAGATVVFADGSGTAVFITGDDGRFHGDAPLGRVSITLYFVDTSYELSAVLAPGAVIERELSVPAFPPVCPPDAEPAVAGDAERAAAAALARAVADPNAVADWNLIRDSGSHWLVDVRVGPKGTIAAPGFVVVDGAKLQREADHRHGSVDYAYIGSVELAGSCAIVHIGVGVVLPKKDHGIPLCCCNQRDAFAKRHGRWEYLGTEGAFCS